MASLLQVDAGDLNVGYTDTGSPDAPVVLLLHGWPYDIHTYDEVVPQLVDAGFRAIVPYLRGYGTTTFRDPGALRTGQPAALARDAIALLDALGVASAVLGGSDWGARTTNIVAALWPERVRGQVTASGYLVAGQAANANPLHPIDELTWWYQFYFATERGRAGYDRYRDEFARLIWHTASPGWEFDDATFERSRPSFGNPDHVDIVIHNYRWRLGLAAGDPALDELEERIAGRPTIPVAAISLEGDENGAFHLDPSAYRDRFTGPYEHRQVTGGIGHNLAQEAPRAFAEAVIDVARMADTGEGAVTGGAADVR
ncbi:alpha/beta hydrolase [Leifsonia sp. fls2-241-R2A-40a]|uniref:alpha/beta hydrolase n=1 Tax=Leifsonia sp. fls2-241-R2A-40a TaxID=3040290 RepID=UPI00254A55C9|nr:alpha/beta hydrolase [Leifsonia sp. fls2-241-R2A-40a]